MIFFQVSQNKYSYTIICGGCTLHLNFVSKTTTDGITFHQTTTTNLLMILHCVAGGWWPIGVCRSFKTFKMYLHFWDHLCGLRTCPALCTRTQCVLALDLQHFTITVVAAFVNWYQNITVGIPPIQSLNNFLTLFRLVVVQCRRSYHCEKLLQCKVSAIFSFEIRHSISAFVDWIRILE